MKVIKRVKYDLNKLYHPDIFQGKFKKKNYFEGWYYKIMDEASKYALAIIPGISLGENTKDSHAFIQILDNQGHTYYIRYGLNEFQYNDSEFEIIIAGNYFSKTAMWLNINRDNVHIFGKLYFAKIVDLPKSLLKPGIMGPFSYINFMECYHGIVNIHHENYGTLHIDDKEVNFNHGYGYIEKDWGKSFPEKWIWIQSNHFKNDNVTLMFSVAKIPWLGFHFKGFLALFRINEYVHVFATYTNAKIRLLEYYDSRIRVIIEDRYYRMIIQADNNTGGSLKAPHKGLMSRMVKESINAKVRVKFMDKQGNVLYCGSGTNAGVEVSI